MAATATLTVLFSATGIASAEELIDAKANESASVAAPPSAMAMAASNRPFASAEDEIGADNGEALPPLPSEASKDVAAAAREELIGRLKSLSDDELIAFLHKAKGEPPTYQLDRTAGDESSHEAKTTSEPVEVSDALRRIGSSITRAVRGAISALPLDRMRKIATPEQVVESLFYTSLGVGALVSAGSIVSKAASGSFLGRNDAGGEGPRAGAADKDNSGGESFTGPGPAGNAQVDRSRLEGDEPSTKSGILWTRTDENNRMGASDGDDRVLWTRREDQGEGDRVPRSREEGGLSGVPSATHNGSRRRRRRRVFTDNVE